MNKKQKGEPFLQGVGCLVMFFSIILFIGRCFGGMLGEHPDPETGRMAAANTSPGYWLWQCTPLIWLVIGALFYRFASPSDKPDRNE